VTSWVPRPQGVPACPLAELAAILGLPDRPAGAVTGVTHASDSVQPGDLFAAMPGTNRHGADFVAAAVAAGAVAVLTDHELERHRLDAGVPTLVVPDPRARLGEVAARVYGDPTARLSVIGITGTAGKTTTAYLLESGLRAAGRQPAVFGTVETRLGDLVLDSVRTTPEAPDLQALLAVAAERGIDSVAMEVSSHALALHRADGIRFAVGGWTNFGLDHLDFHADADDYFAAKARLFDGRCRVEVVNADDPALKAVIGPHTVTYSAAGETHATWYATGVRAATSVAATAARHAGLRSGPGHRVGYEQRFVAHGPAGPVNAGIRLPGRHNVANALLAIAALVGIGIEPQVAADGVAACPGVPGRLEPVPGYSVLGVVDYAHKPDSIVAALAALRTVASEGGGRLICVIGAGGDRDAGKRPLMGAAAARGADLVIVTDDNPRYEDPAAIRAQVLAGAGSGAVEVAGRREAIAHAVRVAAAGDVVAVLGKGHERGQEIAGTVFPFDDRTVLAEELAETG
jgi:UDP-N-acetylmuramoyl-L-alanyl-D-glutamate--2,6-diaminopimelate ligase